MKQEYDLQKELDRMGINQSEFAQIVNVDPRAVRYYISGERPLSSYAKFMIEITQRLPDLKETFFEVAKSVGDKNK